MRSALLWDFAQRRILVPYQSFREIHRSRLQMLSIPFKTGPIFCPETSEIIYHCRPCKIPPKGQISALRYKFLTLESYHPDTIFVGKDMKVCDYFSKPEWFSEQKRFGNTDVKSYWLS